MRGFVCNIVPNELVHVVKTSQATNNFCLHLIKGGAFEKVVSIVPPAFYHPNIEDTYEIKYFNGNPKWSKLRKLVRFVQANINAAKLLNRCDSVWFYNISKVNFLCFLILKYLMRVKVYAIFLDHASSKSLFNFFHYLPYMYQRTDGIISLSQRTFLEHPNMGFKAGVITANSVKEPLKYIEKKKLTFLFSGNLTGPVGFPLAMKVFEKYIDNEIYVSGLGDVDERVLESHPNIHYLGYIDYNEYLKIFNKIDVCLSLRDPSYEENLNNFPSKIIEYFNYGKMLISTMEYPEIKGFKYLYCKYNPEALSNTINNLQNSNIEEWNLLCDNKQALIDNLSVKSWIEAFDKIENKA